MFIDFEVNPFTDSYMKDEVDFYGLKKPYEKNGVKVIMQRIVGRCDDYLNKNFRVGKDDLLVPTLFVYNKLWMSITCMEVQSAFLPVRRAGGDCATAGCGLGYYVLKLMANDKVDTIDVYELDSRVVEFFTSTFSNRTGFDKVNFIAGDVREQMRGKVYDHVFMDIYQTMMPNEVIDDYRLFTAENVIQNYNWWCQEKAILAGLVDFELHPGLELDEATYFKTWQDTPVDLDRASDTCLGNLYQEFYDSNFV